MKHLEKTLLTARSSRLKKFLLLLTRLFNLLYLINHMNTPFQNSLIFSFYFSQSEKQSSQTIVSEPQASLQVFSGFYFFTQPAGIFGMKLKK